MHRVEHTAPVRLVVLGYLTYIVAGWLLLCLPWCRNGAGASMLDHLFTAVSAVSTTGLATVSTSDTYNFSGQLVVVTLIQLGGLGYMTIGSVILLSITGHLTPLRERVGLAAMSLPDSFTIVSFLRLAVCYTLAVEAAGALLLHGLVFSPRGEPNAWWLSVFHSISSFCTAGFGLYNDSFEKFRGDLALNVIIIVLSYLGALGFLVVQDLWYSLRSRSVKITLTSKIIVVGTACIALVGTVLFAVEEPLLGELPATQRWLLSLFQVMSASTTVGFNTLPIGSLSGASVVLLLIVMLIGASPAGTGGGIKTTAITAVWAVMTSVIRRRERPTFLGRAIPDERTRAAVASVLFYCITLAAGTYLLAVTEKASLVDVGFECASALGTVGLSRGITGALTVSGKWIVISLMFVGRIGPLALGLVMVSQKPGRQRSYKEEDIVI